MKLDRRVAIITGAAGSIGAETARLFSREGAHLVLVDTDEASLAKLTADLDAASKIVLDLVGDVSDPEVCRSVVQRTTAQFGRLDILFNNAGITTEGTLLECTEQDWDRVMDVNLKSMYLMCRGVIPIMQHQGGGSVINMACLAGPKGVRGYGALSVSKAGVVGLTKSLATDFLADGIRVNCLCPATVDTQSFRQRLARKPDPVEARRKAVSSLPMGRLLAPQEVAALVVFLASDESRNMTGQTIFMDGGSKL